MHYYNFISLWTRHHYLELIYRQELSGQEYPDGGFFFITGRRRGFPWPEISERGLARDEGG
jgi:hypothetical protein